MIDKGIGIVYESMQYEQFKRLEGNRDCTEARAKKIESNIKQNGYVLNPIVVNEHYEVIDGQGRLQALKNLHLPVHYVVAKGAGVQQCAILNAASTPWKLSDYISSYAQLDNENYVLLKSLFDEYTKYSLATKCILITGRTLKNGVDTIKTGNFMFTRTMYEESKKNFERIEKFRDDLDRARGKKEEYVFAIIFGINNGMSEGRLLKQLNLTTLPPTATRKMALDTVSDIYNKGLAIDRRIYLKPLYEQSMIGKYGWYESRLPKNGGKGW